MKNLLMPLEMIQRTLYYPTCANTVPDPSCSECPTKELGDVRSTFFLKESSPFIDITDQTEWETKINAGDLVVFPYTRGTLEVTPLESNGFGDQTTTTDGYDYVLNFEEPQYADNWAFWNAIKDSQIYKAGYRTETQVHLSDNTARVIPMNPIGDDKKAIVNWKVSAKWSQENLMRPYDAPNVIFNQCYNVT
jgi:hypothetical protein